MRTARLSHAALPSAGNRARGFSLQCQLDQTVELFLDETRLDPRRPIGRGAQADALVTPQQREKRIHRLDPVALATASVPARAGSTRAMHTVLQTASRLPIPDLKPDHPHQGIWPGSPGALTRMANWPTSTKAALPSALADVFGAAGPVQILGEDAFGPRNTTAANSTMHGQSQAEIGVLACRCTPGCCKERRYAARSLYH